MSQNKTEFIIEIINLRKHLIEGKTKQDVKVLIDIFLQKERESCFTNIIETKDGVYYKGYIYINTEEDKNRIFKKLQRDLPKIFEVSVKYVDAYEEKKKKQGKGTQIIGNPSIQSNKKKHKLITLDDIKEKIFKKYQSVLLKEFEYKFDGKFLELKGHFSEKAYQDIVNLFIKNKLKPNHENYKKNVVLGWSKININMEQAILLKKDLSALEKECLCFYEIMDGQINFVGTSYFIDQVEKLIKGYKEKISPFLKSLGLDDITIDESDTVSEFESDTDHQSDLSEIESDIEDQQEKIIFIPYGAKFVDKFKEVIKSDKTVQFIVKPKEKHLRIKITTNDPEKIEEKENILTSLFAIETIDIPKGDFSFYNKGFDKIKEEVKGFSNPKKRLFDMNISKNDSKIYIISESQSFCEALVEYVEKKLENLEYERSFTVYSMIKLRFFTEQLNNEEFLSKYDMDGIKFKTFDIQGGKFKGTKIEIYGPKKLIDHTFRVISDMIGSFKSVKKEYSVKNTNINYVVLQLKDEKFDEAVISYHYDRGETNSSLKVEYLSLDELGIEKTKKKVEYIIKKSKTIKVILEKVKREKIQNLTKTLEKEYSTISFKILDPTKEHSDSVNVLINGKDDSEIESAKTELLNESMKSRPISVQVQIYDRFIMDDFKNSLITDVSKGIKLSVKPPTIFLNGDSNLIKTAAKKIEKFYEYNLSKYSIECMEFPLEIKKLFLTTDFKNKVYDLEVEKKCRIEIFDNVLTYTPIQNCIVKLIIGDIFNAYCNVVVNPTDINLNHSGKIANTIITKAGKFVINECVEWLKTNKLTVGKCMMTNSGNLKCQKLIHTVEPIYQGKKLNPTLLESSVIEVLLLADKNMFQSIALPAISTGYTDCPVNEVLEIITNAVKQVAPKLEYIRSISFYTNDKNVASLWKKQMLSIMKSKDLSKNNLKVEKPKNNCLWYYKDYEDEWRAYSTQINDLIEDNIKNNEMEFDVKILNQNYHFNLKKATQTNINTGTKKLMTNKIPTELSYSWEWNTSSGYQTYNVKQSEIIEKEYQKYLKFNQNLVEITIQISSNENNTFILDFSKMIQINKITKKERKLMRELLKKPVKIEVDKEENDTLILSSCVEFLGKNTTSAIQAFKDLEKNYITEKVFNIELDPLIIEKLINDTKCKITSKNGKLTCQGYVNQVENASQYISYLSK